MLFTRKGDKGKTDTFNQEERISKEGKLPEALGTVDELNSLLGVCKIKAGERPVATNDDIDVEDIVGRVQHDLFIVQAELAGADKAIQDEKVKRMEEIIRRIEEELPPITTFFVSGGTELSALLDYARAVARRAERRLISVADEKNISQPTRSYMNRLSSLLFAMARLANAKSGIKEESPTYE